MVWFTFPLSLWPSCLVQDNFWLNSHWLLLLWYLQLNCGCSLAWHAMITIKGDNWTPRLGVWSPLAGRISMKRAYGRGALLASLFAGWESKKEFRLRDWVLSGPSLWWFPLFPGTLLQSRGRPESGTSWLACRRTSRVGKRSSWLRVFKSESLPMAVLLRLTSPWNKALLAHFFCLLGVYGCDKSLKKRASFSSAVF